MDSNNILKIISEFLENEFPEHTLYLSDLTDYNSWKFRMEGVKNGKGIGDIQSETRSGWRK